jgi:exosortase C (VPDSG-CTERM-specific)
VLLAICFGKPLYDLLLFAWQSDLYSHILLVPFISLYLIRLKRGGLAPESRPVRILSVVPLVFGAAGLASYWCAEHSGWKLARVDYLALMAVSFLCLLLSGACVFLGAKTLRQVAFPVALLIFTVPFPAVLLGWIEAGLQQGSSVVAEWLFTIFGMPVLRQGTSFRLPGFPLEVAPECSGIHSSLVLVITSLVAGNLFLRGSWQRAVFTFSVLPLALLRNGFRIFTIGELCVNISPDMINSFIHTRGGPIFFALSIVPLFLFLLFLRKLEPGSEVSSVNQEKRNCL